jgi:hypothetical protein
LSTTNPTCLPGREPRPLRWEASDYPLELWHGLQMKENEEGRKNKELKEEIMRIIQRLHREKKKRHKEIRRV